jgi:hypothetical protein
MLQVSFQTLLPQPQAQKGHPRSIFAFLPLPILGREALIPASKLLKPIASHVTQDWGSEVSRSLSIVDFGLDGRF